MSTEEPTNLNLTPQMLAQAKKAAMAAQDDHPEGAAIRRQVSLQQSIDVRTIHR
jgi:hypothetical protein